MEALLLHVLLIFCFGILAGMSLKSKSPIFALFWMIPAALYCLVITLKVEEMVLRGNIENQQELRSQ